MEEFCLAKLGIKLSVSHVMVSPIPHPDIKVSLIGIFRFYEHTANKVEITLHLLSPPATVGMSRLAKP